MLLSLPLAISALGLLMIYDASRNRLAADGLSRLYYVERQGIAIGLGLIAMVVVIAFDYRRIRDLWLLWYLAIMPLLAAVLVLGRNHKGAQAWFQVGPLQFQPSELAKIAVVVAIAGYCHQHRGDLDAWRLAVAIGLAGVVMAHRVRPARPRDHARDHGVRGRGARRRRPQAGAHRGAADARGHPRRRGRGQRQGAGVSARPAHRFHRPVDEGRDEPAAHAHGYNLKASKTAIASGGLTGAGLVEGLQTKNGFVPEQHTDFIFTAVGEDLGFIGGATLLVLYALLAWRLWRIALLSSDFFGTLLAIGVLAMFAIQVFENVGMTMGIMPITGIPLPFMSYGGSAIIASFIAIGLVLNVHMRRFS